MLSRSNVSCPHIIIKSCFQHNGKMSGKLGPDIFLSFPFKFEEAAGDCLVQTRSGQQDTLWIFQAWVVSYAGGRTLSFKLTSSSKSITFLAPLWDICLILFWFVFQFCICQKHHQHGSLWHVPSMLLKDLQEKLTQTFGFSRCPPKMFWEISGAQS